MAINDQAVRDAALALKSAIVDAQAAGYRVVWPANADELDRIAVSATDKVLEEPKAAEDARASAPGAPASSRPPGPGSR